MKMKATVQWSDDFEKYMFIFRVPFNEYEKPFDIQYLNEFFDVDQHFDNPVYYGLNTYTEHVLLLNSLKGLQDKRELVLAKLTFGIDLIDEETATRLVQEAWAASFRAKKEHPSEILDECLRNAGQ